ncbi:DUF502 domain-containing protein [Methylobrevis albus]|uniref:DUF502 domain-containing protein n=1 Tax=Methylobrevis albus TaxID=2793297 RepID=UPI002E27E854|nr:DUF502 domain-containing protein [Methylobrevis albus]
MITRLRTYFLTGLIVAGPAGITLYVSWSLITWIDGWVKPYLPRAYNPETYLSIPVPGFGLFVALFGITLIGFLTANIVGRTLIHWGEGLLGRMPIVRNLYGGLKQIFQTVLSNRGESFQKVGVIEYPRLGLYSLVFVSVPARGELAARLADTTGDDDEMMGVFLPTTPNPTSGYLLYVRRSEIIYLEMSVEDAAKLIISAGLVTPDMLSNDPDQPKPLHAPAA